MWALPPFLGGRESRVIYSSGLLQTHYVADDDLEFVIRLRLPPQSRVHHHTWLYEVLGIKPSVS